MPRRVATPPGLRSHLTRVKRAVGAASCVRESIRFAGFELAGRTTTADYRLRGSALRATVRQPLLDAWVLEEIFRLGAYRFPEPVLDRLKRLGRPPAILDLGGHVGLFVLAALQSLPDARATSFEPDPSNAATLRRCIETNDLGSGWQLIEAAAAPADGRAEFLSDFHLSHLASDPAQLGQEHDALRRIFPFLDGTNLLSKTSVTVEVRDAFPHMQAADLLKIDIQGGEWDLLLDARFEDLTAEAIVLEIHPAACPHADPRELVADRLDRAGFVEVESRPAHSDEWMLWALRAPVAP